MIPHIPDQRKTKALNKFSDLVKYITQDGKTVYVAQEAQVGTKGRSADPDFANLVNYATGANENNADGEKCIAVRVHGVNNISTAALEMNAVAKKNTRCEDPAYHIILSWPEHEHPEPDKIFDAAEHALKALGLAEHQYVVAIHGNTDNTHCHISVNRIHPVTFKSAHIEWATKTLHLAARQSEIKHGWSHDNGIYVVEIDGHGKKHIVLNTDHSKAVAGTSPRVHKEFGTQEAIPTWHDPDSLDSWLKSHVSKALKRALPGLDGWHALHAWLDAYDITVSDSGGGGLRLHAVSPETGEELDLAASKGLRILKRAELEKRWGHFAGSVQIPSVVPDLSHLTPQQLNKGIEDVITSTLDAGRPPQHVLDRSPGIGRSPEHILRPQQHSEGDATARTGGVHELSAGNLDGDRSGGLGLLPGALHGGLGDSPAGQDSPMRRPGAGEAGRRSKRSLNRDDTRRAERREERALARADLRARYAQYKRFVRVGDTEHFARLKEAKEERSQILKQIQDDSKAAKKDLLKTQDPRQRLLANIAIDAECVGRKLRADAIFREKHDALRATRTPPLDWRTWLYEQSNLGDQAALSALRGIVYQAQRDAKGSGNDLAEEANGEPETNEYRDHQYKKLLARLLKEEQDEIAIRSANSQLMRPHEVDALLAQYNRMQWRVTGNGNVEYTTLRGAHLFTDRGNRVTFDRVLVSDADIRLALAHAQQKFGKQLTLTGDNVAFTERMARLADEMGLTVLNPDMRAVIEAHRADRELQIIEAPTVTAQAVETVSVEPLGELAALPSTPATSIEDTLREMVLAIDPGARFVIPDPASGDLYYTGPVAVSSENPVPGFAQHTGRSVYVLHAIEAPDREPDASIGVRYRKGKATAIELPTDRTLAKPRSPAHRVTQEKPAVERSAVAREIPTPITPAPAPQVALPSASDWLARWSASERKTIIEASSENADVTYTVLYVALDGVVIDKGRGGAVYPVPDGEPIQTGDKVVVNAQGLLQAPSQARSTNSKERPR